MIKRFINYIRNVIHANSLQKKAAQKLRTTLSSNENTQISAGMTTSGVGLTLSFN